MYIQALKPAGATSPRHISGVKPEYQAAALRLLEKFDRLGHYLKKSCRDNQNGHTVRVVNGRLQDSGLNSALDAAKYAVSLLSLGLFKNESRLTEGVFSGTGEFDEHGRLRFLHICCDLQSESRQELYNLHTAEDGTKTFSILRERTETLIVLRDGTARYAPVSTLDSEQIQTI